MIALSVEYLMILATFVVHFGVVSTQTLVIWALTVLCSIFQYSLSEWRLIDRWSEVWQCVGGLCRFTVISSLSLQPCSSLGHKSAPQSKWIIQSCYKKRDQVHQRLLWRTENDGRVTSLMTSLMPAAAAAAARLLNRLSRLVVDLRQRAASPPCTEHHAYFCSQC